MRAIAAVLEYLLARRKIPDHPEPDGVACDPPEWVPGQADGKPEFPHATQPLKESGRAQCTLPLVFASAGGHRVVAGDVQERGGEGDTVAVGGIRGAEVEAHVYLAMGATLNNSIRIAIEKPPHLDRQHLIDLTAHMLTIGLDPHQSDALPPPAAGDHPQTGDR
jgi:hypothetical protein